MERTEDAIQRCQLDESFRPPFSKGGAVEAAEASSRSAEREITFAAFLFGKLAKRFAASLRAYSYFLCAYMVKEKSG